MMNCVWKGPDITLTPPDDLISHARTLNRDLQSTKDYFRQALISQKNVPTIPSFVGKQIRTAVKNGINQIVSTDGLPACYATPLQNAIIKKITREAGLTLRETIPLAYFNDLLTSYTSLANKIDSHKLLLQQALYPSPESAADEDSVSGEDVGDTDGSGDTGSSSGSGSEGEDGDTTGSSDSDSDDGGEDMDSKSLKKASALHDKESCRLDDMQGQQSEIRSMEAQDGDADEEEDSDSDEDSSDEATGSEEDTEMDKRRGGNEESLENDQVGDKSHHEHAVSLRNVRMSSELAIRDRSLGPNPDVAVAAQSGVAREHQLDQEGSQRQESGIQSTQALEDLRSDIKTLGLPAGGPSIPSAEVQQGTDLPAGSGQNAQVIRCSLGIANQSTVNRLVGLTANDLLNGVRRALDTLIQHHPHMPTDMMVHAASHREDGDVEVVINSNPIEDSGSRISLSVWASSFEASIGIPMPEGRSWAIEIPYRTPTNILDLESRKGKASAIYRLVHANIQRLDNLHSVEDITDIGFRRPARGKALVAIDCRTRQLANEVILQGLIWCGAVRRCEGAEHNLRLRRCARCQGFGHVAERCKLPYWCGKCAQQHRTNDCDANFTKCAACGDDHPASSSLCLAKAIERRRLLYQTPTPVEIGPSMQPADIATGSSRAGHVEAEPMTRPPVIKEPVIKIEEDPPGIEQMITDDEQPTLADLFAEIRGMKEELARLKNEPQGTKRVFEEDNDTAVQHNNEQEVKRARIEKQPDQSYQRYRQPSLFHLDRSQMPHLHG